MENSKMKEALKVLGFESFESVPLDQLFRAITEKVPSDTSKLRTLSIYVMWLHPRLMAIDVSSESLTQEIATWYQFLKDRATPDHIIFEAFHDWQRSQAKEDPTSSRRLSIAEAELRSLMTASPASPKPVLEPATPKTEGLYGQMHPDRLKLSREARTVIEIDDDDDDDDDVVVISSRSLRDCPTPPRKNGRDRQPDLSFLTGANMLAVKDMSKAPQRNKSPEPPKTKRKSSSKSSESRPPQPKKEEARASKQPPPSYYICDRCGQKGHFLKDCPTNLDPAFDRTPPKDYKCHFCRKVGVHYGPMCPRNPQPDSIAAQRREQAKAAAISGRTGGERQLEYRDRFLGDRPERARNDRQSQLDNYAPARDRSRSPARRARRHCRSDNYRPEDHRSEDKYRPEDEFSCLSLKAPEHQCKRKASRSPSPHKVEPRKKSQAWDDDSVADRPPNRRIFFDDVANRRGNQWEGRLSYDDEVDEDFPQTRPAKRVSFAPAVEAVEDVDEMDVDEPESPVLEMDDQGACTPEGQSSGLEITEMIQIESVKTDLLLFIDKLFMGHEGIWVNQTLNKIRPRSTDFYEIFEDDEPVETSNCKVVAEIEAATDEEEECVADPHGVVGSIAMTDTSVSSVNGADTTSSLTVSTAGEVVDTETSESSPPLVDDGAPRVKGPATGKSVADLVAESTVDAAMTDVEDRLVLEPLLASIAEQIEMALEGDSVSGRCRVL